MLRRVTLTLVFLIKPFEWSRGLAEEGSVEMNFDAQDIAAPA